MPVNFAFTVVAHAASVPPALVHGTVHSCAARLPCSEHFSPLLQSESPEHGPPMSWSVALPDELLLLDDEVDEEVELLVDDDEDDEDDELWPDELLDEELVVPLVELELELSSLLLHAAWKPANAISALTATR